MLNDDAKTPQAVQQQKEALQDALTGSTTSSGRTEIVFIDRSVENYEELLKGIDASAEVILIDGDKDGIEFIADTIKERNDIDAIHIISHGTAGQLNLGNAALTQASIEGEYADELLVIGQALSSDADILLYGCNFAEGDIGEAAANALSKATGADIAASDDLTGAEQLGGDWDLEVASGAIEAKAFNAQLAGFDNFGGLLVDGDDDNDGILDVTEGDRDITTWTITDTTGVTTSSNSVSYGGSSSSSSEWGQNGARSDNFSTYGSNDNFTVSWTVSNNTGIAISGLGINETSSSFSDIDYAIYTNAGTLSILENGVPIRDFGTYMAGEKLSITTRNGTVTYQKDGVTFYTSTKTYAASSTDFYLDTAFYRGALSYDNYAIVTDSDGDGIANSADLDSDNDGISDLQESGVAAAIIAADSNNDGTISIAEAEAVSGIGTGNADVNGDGLLDIFTATVGTTPVNSDSDTLADYIDLDSDADGIADAIEAKNHSGYANNRGVTGEIGLAASLGTGFNAADHLGSNSTLAGLGDDAFSYNLENPTSPTPDFVYDNTDGTGNGLVAKNTANVVVDFKLNSSFTQDVNNKYVIDIYGRDIAQVRDDNITIKVFDTQGGSLGEITNVKVPDTTTPHIRVDISARLGLASGVSIGSFTLSNPDVNTTIMEVRSARIEGTNNKDADADGVIALYDSNDAASPKFGGTFVIPKDTDGDEVADYLDTDSDGDGTSDASESGLTLSGADANNDGIDDNASIGASYGDGVINNPSADLDSGSSTNTTEWSITGAANVTEGASASYTISLSGTFGANQAASVDISLTDTTTSAADHTAIVTAINTAIAGRAELSFNGTKLTYTSPTNGSSMTDLTISLLATDDALVEVNETYLVGLAGAAGTNAVTASVKAGNDKVTTIINDNDTTLALSATTPVTEGGSITYTATLGNAADGAVTVNLNNGTAITIADGATTGTSVVTVSDDVYVSANASVAITGATGGNFEKLVFATTPAVTVVTDVVDDALISIAGPGTVSEGATTGAYTVTIKDTSGNAVNATTAVTIALSYSGVANEGADFTGVADVTIAAGTSSGTFDIAALTDGAVEGSEDFTVTLGAVTGSATAGGFENLIVDITNDNATTTIAEVIDDTPIALGDILLEIADSDSGDGDGGDSNSLTGPNKLRVPGSAISESSLVSSNAFENRSSYSYSIGDTTITGPGTLVGYVYRSDVAETSSLLGAGESSDQLEINSGSVNRSLFLDIKFVESSGSEVEAMSISQADGEALPPWLQFDADSGQLSGDAPEGVENVKLRVLVELADGVEVLKYIQVDAGNGEVTEISDGDDLDLSGVQPFSSQIDTFAKQFATSSMFNS